MIFSTKLLGDAVGFNSSLASTPSSGKALRCSSIGKDDLIAGSTRSTRRFSKASLNEWKRRISPCAGIKVEWQSLREVYQNAEHGSICSWTDGDRFHRAQFGLNEMIRNLLAAQPSPYNVWKTVGQGAKIARGHNYRKQGCGTDKEQQRAAIDGYAVRVPIPESCIRRLGVRAAET